MANSKSAEKRIRVNNKKRLINKARKSKVKTMLKKLLIMDSGDEKNIFAQSCQKEIDKAAAKGIFHKNKAARMKSRMSKNSF